MENPRIEQLKRRVRADPASIAFAALAEEYRKDGRYPEAIETCRLGLQRHPAYLSARVTLGRALIGVGDYEAARLELEAVLRIAPENLAAIRAMADIYSRLRDADDIPADDLEAAIAGEVSLEEDGVEPEPPAPEPPAIPRAPLAVVSLHSEAHRNDVPVRRLEKFLDSIRAARAELTGAERPAK